MRIVTKAASALIIFLASTLAHAATTVYLDNRTDLTVKLTSRQSGEQMAQSAWSQKLGWFGPRQKHAILTFERGDAVKKNRVYYFNTEVAVGDEALTLKQELTGTPASSEMSVSLATGSWNDQWYGSADYSVHTGTWKLGERTIQITYQKLFVKLGNDDVLYTLEEVQTAKEEAPEDFQLVTYNVQMRPILDSDWDERVEPIARALSGKGYDVVVLNEVFDADARKALLEAFRKEFPFSTSPLGAGDALRKNGGVLILSRWPILKQAQRVFRTGQGADALACKGFVWAQVSRPDRAVHVIATHLQAGGSEAVETRAAQMGEMRRFLEAAVIPREELVLIAGDLNVGKLFSEGQPAGEYRDMLELLDASLPADQSGHTPSCGEGATLDYVLYSNAHRTPAKDSSIRTLKIDLSDHRPVLGRFQFSK